MLMSVSANNIMYRKSCNKRCGHLLEHGFGAPDVTSTAGRRVFEKQCL